MVPAFWVYLLLLKVCGRITATALFGQKKKKYTATAPLTKNNTATAALSYFVLFYFILF